MKSRLLMGILVILLLPSGLLAKKDFVQEVEEAYQKMAGLQAQFVQTTYIELLDRDKTREGTLFLSHNRFRINYKKPEPQEYIYNGETLWIYSPSYKEVEIYDDANQQLSREALSFLSGLGQLRETFRVKVADKKAKLPRLILVPKSKNSRFKKIELVIHPESYHIQEATLWPKRGNRSHYFFSNFKTNSKSDDTLFEFKVPKKTTILRPTAT